MSIFDDDLENIFISPPKKTPKDASKNPSQNASNTAASNATSNATSNAASGNAARSAAARSGEFFPFHIDLAWKITEEGGGVHEVLAYVVMSRGAGRYDSTAWNVHGVAKRLGCPMSVADAAVNWLICRKYLEPKTAEDEATGESESRMFVNRDGLGEAMYMPNALVDGIRGQGSQPDSRPLAKLLADIRIDCASGIGAKEARLDAVVLLLDLYHNHNLYEWGGVDPRLWHRRWVPRASGLMGSQYQITLPGERTVFINEIARDKEIKWKVTKEDDDNKDYFSDFVHAVFSHVKDEAQRLKRFQFAIVNLKKAGLIYEVLQIWDQDPIPPQEDFDLDEDDLDFEEEIAEPGQDYVDLKEDCVKTDEDFWEPGYDPHTFHVTVPTARKAQIVYPLYVFDRIARECKHEPSLHHCINQLAVAEYSSIFGQDNLFESDGSSNVIHNDQFRYISFEGQTLVPLSTLRLRFRPHNHDTGIGMQEQAGMVQAWEEQLSQDYQAEQW